MRKQIEAVLGLSVVVIFLMMGTVKSEGLSLAEESISSPLWRLDEGFSSTIRVQASPGSDSITVWPVLFLEGGRMLQLNSRSVGHGGVASIDIREELLGLLPDSGDFLSAHGSAALYYSGPAGAISASVLIDDVERSLVFTNGFIAPREVEADLQRAESLWWRPTAKTNYFLALNNPGAGYRSVDLEISDDAGEILHSRSLQIAPHPCWFLDSKKLKGVGFHGIGKGGIEVRYWGRPGDLLYAGGLVDEKAGFSLNLPFWQRQADGTPSEERVFAATGISNGRLAVDGTACPFLHFWFYATWLTSRWRSRSGLPAWTARKNPKDSSGS